MVIISKAVLNDFILSHPESANAVLKWYEYVKKADWSNFAELKHTFNSTDYAGNERYVFNIKGNKYRLVALILFQVRTVFILFIGTHTEYERVNASTITFKK